MKFLPSHVQPSAVVTVAGILTLFTLLIAADGTLKDEQETIDRRPALEQSAPGQFGVQYITLRNRTGDPDPSRFYGDERDTVHTGICKVAWNPITALDTLAKNAPIYIPTESIQTRDIEEIEPQVFWQEYARRLNGARPVLYIHGYNVGFDKGCKRAARFAQNLNLGNRLLFFSWPSDGDTLNYTRDEADVAWSIHYLKETIIRMETLFGRGGFDVVGHSLGGRGAALAVATLPSHGNNEGPIIDQLVLIAPDIDAAIFRQQLAVLKPRAKQITVYASKKDSALALSREVHGYPRLGESGPHIIGLQGIEVVDVTHLGRRRVSGHVYHLYNTPAIEDIEGLLNGRLPAADRDGPIQVDPTVPNYWRLKPGEEFEDSPE